MKQTLESDLQNGHSTALEQEPLETSGCEQQPPSTAPSLPGTQGLESDLLEPIAVIGFAARLPQDATNAEAFWQMLCDGRDARTEIPQDRFNIEAFYHPDPNRIDAVSLQTYWTA